MVQFESPKLSTNTSNVNIKIINASDDNSEHKLQGPITPLYMTPTVNNRGKFGR